MEGKQTMSFWDKEGQREAFVAGTDDHVIKVSTWIKVFLPRVVNGQLEEQDRGYNYHDLSMSWRFGARVVENSWHGS